MGKQFLDLSGLNQVWTRINNLFQRKLVSGTNIKTINGNNLLGNGNITTPNTTYNKATTSNDGLLPKLSGNTGQYLNGSGNWTTPPNTTYNKATSSTLGLVKIGATGLGDKQYPIQLDSQGRMFVSVPWVDTTGGGDYLPLSGGTLTGALNIDFGNNDIISFKKDGANPSFVISRYTEERTDNLFEVNFQRNYAILTLGIYDYNLNEIKFDTSKDDQSCIMFNASPYAEAITGDELNDILV